MTLPFDWYIFDEIAKKLRESKEQLKSLGDQRETAEQQRHALREIVSSFQDTIQHAIWADYGLDKLLRTGQFTRLSTIIINRTETFREIRSGFGRTYAFYLPDTQKQKPDPSFLVALERGSKSNNTVAPPKHQDILDEIKPVALVLRSGIIPWIRTHHNNVWGFGIGTSNPTLIPTLMNEQCAKWQLCQRYYQYSSFVHTRSPSLCLQRL